MHTHTQTHTGELLDVCYFLKLNPFSFPPLSFFTMQEITCDSRVSAGL